MSQVSQDVQIIVGEFYEQIVDNARRFFGDSMGSLKSRLQSDSSELRSLLEQLPKSQEEPRSQLKKLLGSYEDVEFII